MRDDGRPQRLGDRTAIRAAASERVDLIRPSPKLRSLGTGVDELSPFVFELLVAQQLLIAADQVVVRLVAFDAVLRVLDVVAQLRQS